MKFLLILSVLFFGCHQLDETQTNLNQIKKDLTEIDVNLTKAENTLAETKCILERFYSEDYNFDIEGERFCLWKEGTLPCEITRQDFTKYITWVCSVDRFFEVKF